MNQLHNISLFALLSLAAMVLGSCDKAIYEDLSACVQGVDVSYYAQTPCEAVASYPGDVKEVRLFAFDEQGILLGAYDATNVQLSADYKQRVEHYHVGTSSLAAWASADLSKYDFSAFVPGKTSKAEMTLSLQQQAANAGHAIAPAPALYVGGTELTQMDRSKDGTIYDQVSINLRKITNTIHLTVKGLNSNPQGNMYDVYIVSSNGVYDMAGGIVAGAPQITYDPQSGSYTDGKYHADYNLMKLDGNDDLRLMVVDRRSNTTTFTAPGSVAEALRQVAKLNGKSLACIHDFHIEMEVKINPLGQYVVVMCAVQKWNVVYRVVDL